MYTWSSIIQKSTSNGNRALGKFLKPQPSPGLVFMAQKCQNHQQLIVCMQVAFFGVWDTTRPEVSVHTISQSNKTKFCP